jgi:hypothetical protein
VGESLFFLSATSLVRLESFVKRYAKLVGKRELSFVKKR